MSNKTDIRVIKSKDANGVFFGLRRVYYASQGSIESVDPIDFTPYGETVSDLRAEHALTSRAFEKPVVDRTK